MKKNNDDKIIENLEKSKEEALKRVAARMKDRKNFEGAQATHQSHSSNPQGRTHSSYITS